jgi:hypothetical protein
VLFVGPSDLHVVAGSESEVLVALQSQRLRIQLQAADGASLREQRVLLEHAASAFSGRSDAEGVLLLDPPPPWPVEIVTWQPQDLAVLPQLDAAERKRRSVPQGTVEMPAGQTAFAVDLRLPAPARAR